MACCYQYFRNLDSKNEIFLFICGMDIGDRFIFLCAPMAFEFSLYWGFEYCFFGYLDIIGAGSSYYTAMLVGKKVRTYQLSSDIKTDD